MRLKVMAPTEPLIDREVEKVIAESPAGSFCLEPRHVDYVSPLTPGILSFVSEGEESFIGVAEGILVKAGAEVLVSVRDAVTGAPLGELREAVAERFEAIEERESEARRVAGKLEAALVRRFMELEERA